MEEISNIDIAGCKCDITHVFQINQTGTYQFLSSIGNKSFAMQMTLPVPISTFKESRDLVVAFRTSKFLIADFPGDADFFISIG